jgi:hypothetical protein
MAIGSGMGTAPREYGKCGNELVSPGAPEGITCERPRGHAWIHRKTLGGSVLTWLNGEPESARSVHAYLPTMAHDGRVFIGGHDVSPVVAGVVVDAQVGNITELTIRLKPGELDIDAEGRGKVTAGAHQLLTLLGWTPPPGDAS